LQQQYERAQPPPNPPYPNSAVAQLGLTTKEIEEVLRDQEERLREEEQREQEIDAHTTEQTQHQQWERHGNDNGTQPTPTPFEYDAHDTTNNYDEHVVSFVGDASSDNGANIEPDHDMMIKQLANELIASGGTGRSWAEEMENEMRSTLQGEYMAPSYPAPPSPTPWYPPPPPTSDYAPP
jgi:hypothetical protein